MSQGESDMPRDEDPVSRLSSKQALAIDHLATRMNPTDVATTVGISREQLWRWRAQNEVFALQLARRRAELHQAIINRFWRVSGKALDVAEETLDERDRQVAIDILRLAAKGMTDLRVEEAAPGGDRTPDAAALSSDAPSFVCPDCDTVPRSKAGLTRHRNAKHV